MSNILIGIISWVVAFLLLGGAVIWTRILPIIGAGVLFIILPISFPTMVIFSRMLWTVAALVVFLFIHKELTKGGKQNVR